MNIRPKNMILYADTGVKFSLSNLGGANWRQQVFNNYRLHLLDLLAKYGEAEDYGQWLNEMLSRHSQIYNLAGGRDGNWQNEAYKNDLVGLYLHDYKGDLRFGKILIDPTDTYNFNLGITPNYNTRYDIANPPRRVSGDRTSLDYKVDSLYSSITDDRRLLGRKGDWDENSDEFKLWQSDLNKSGWETYLDSNDNYYKLRRLAPKINGEEQPLVPNLENSVNKVLIPINHQDSYGFDWGKLREGALKLFSNPDLWATARLAGNLINNDRVYGELLKGIKPVLRLSYHTYRQVVGDEATKQAFYRRAAQGQTKAARPFTSDADRLMAYLMEAKRIGDDLRALGDLADNQEIHRTSDESNQHQWANTQRDTEVANANLASINQANAAKHLLLALKHSAQWSSIDNYLKGIEYRKRQKNAELQAIDDQLFALLLHQDLINDPRIINALKAYQSVLDKHKLPTGGYDMNNDEVVAAKREYDLFLNKIAIEQYKKRKLYYLNRNAIFSAKSGIKITRKKKDDSLYKSTRDVVEHFRKMSKISSDANDRKAPKIERLTSHPKGKTKKYLYGGVAPFTVYTPVALGGETSSQITASTSSSSKSSKDTDGLDLIKELFKSLLLEGLPSDVSGIFLAMNNLMSRKAAFGEELSTGDIASMYILLMLQINNIKFNKALFDLALKTVNEKNAGSELALDLFGRLAVLDKEGKIKYRKYEELKEDDKPLRNDDLLALRSSVESYAFDNNMLQVASNATSMSEIAKFLKEQLPKIESSETVIEGYTKKDSNLIKEGLRVLQEAPEGDYKYSETIKNNGLQIKMALGYLLRILPNNMKNLLKLNAKLENSSMEEILTDLVGAQVTGVHKYELDAVTGKAAKDSNGNSKSTDGDIKSNFLDLIQRDLIGIDREFSLITKDGNSKLYSLNSKYISLLPNVSEDMSLERMLGESKIGSIMDSRLGVTFGDLVIDPSNFKDIMFDLGGGATIVTLPCKYENGHKVVNFAIKDEFDDAVKEVSKTISVDYSNARFVKALSEKLHEKGLDSLLSGNNLDPNMLGHFMVVSAYTTDKVGFNTDSRYIEKVRNPDKALEERIIKGLSTNKDKNDYELDINDKWGIFELTYDDIYRGSVFIPLNNDPVSALTGWGNDNIKLDETRNLAEQYLNYQKSSKQKDSSSNNL